MEELHKEVVANIRACLVSTKEKCSLRQVNRDYKLLMGSDIPYQKLGFNSLEKFISSVSSLKITNIDNMLYITAKESEKSSHIATLVKSQKTKKRKPSSYKPTRRSYAYRDKWQPPVAKNAYQNSPRPGTVRHNQRVNIPSPPPPPRQTTISTRLASRLGPKVSERQTSLPEIKETNLDELFTKTKQRLMSKFNNININDANNLESEVFNDSIEIEEPPPNFISEIALPTVHSAPVTDTSKQFIWPNAASTVDNDFIISPSATFHNVMSTNSFRNRMVQPFEPTGNHLQDLERFALLHNLGEPKIKTVKRKSKLHKQPFVDCQIKIELHSFSSYPHDFHNELDATQEAAKQSLEGLMAIYNQNKQFLISGEAEVLERIPPIVQSHYYGIWKEQLEADYSEKFSEQLPINWLEIVDYSPNISVTPCLDRFVLRYCKPGEKGLDSTQYVSNISVPSNLAAFDHERTLTGIITCPVSASEIWCRQINTDDYVAFESMSARMDQYCNATGNLVQAETVDIGGYYIAFAKDGMTWCRVRTYEFNDDDSVNCFCIDYGDDIIVNRNELYALPLQFARVQAQVFVCRLAGVEDYYEVSKSSEFLKSLAGKVVHVQLTEIDPVDEDGTHNAILYDIEEETVINEEARKSFETAMYTVPKLKDAATEVYLAHATEDGLVYLHIPYFGNNHLTDTLDELQNLILNGEIAVPRTTITRESSNSQLYFIENQERRHWCRFKILEWAPSPKRYVQIQYVDYGTTDVVHVDEIVIYSLEDISKAANKYEGRAVLARFAAEKIPSDFVQTVRRLIPEDKPVIAKVVGWEFNDIPIVQFYKRSQPDNVLFSINDSIMSDIQVSNPSVNGKTHNNRLQKVLLQNDNTKVPSAGLLKCPDLPALNEFFDVVIPCAVNPYNFFVQPYKSRSELITLMNNLQIRNKGVQNCSLSIRDIVPGKIYASKYEDGSWYRTTVIKVINPGSISVFYCDYGYYANLTLQQLGPLDEDFLELPFQAIKAKLAGIQPKNSKWSMDDCRFFEKLVCRKYFVSVLQGIGRDEYYRCDTVLSLKLVDTTTSKDKDIYIHQILIDADIAVAQ